MDFCESPEVAKKTRLFLLKYDPEFLQKVPMKNYFSIFGICDQFSSDFGPQFKSSQFQSFLIFDSNLSLRNHVTHLCQSVRFQLRNFGSIRKYFPKFAAEQLIHALISSRLDFCNSLFCNLPQRDISRIQRLQNCAARLLTYTKKTTHITPVLRSLHWLPVDKRIKFKILLLVYRTLHTSAQDCLLSRC